MITVNDFVDEFNYMMQNGVGQLDMNDADEMLYYKESVASMMQDNCGEVKPFEVINDKGQIKLIEGEGGWISILPILFIILFHIGLVVFGAWLGAIVGIYFFSKKVGEKNVR